MVSHTATVKQDLAGAWFRERTRLKLELVVAASFVDDDLVHGLKTHGISTRQTRH
ncbi:hypothetical protein OCOJLMKI_4937 [Methylobacterium iners]|uniref:Uncharacterized protein n=1 Tax=Methylobacterium iners TaxID=418707 RepID=A0ABQ4S3N2_9HYPH|nr:hypothetical protein OCOJLMKI_4937 [Methylobacterium iners]